MHKRKSNDVNQMAKNVVDRIIELTEGRQKPEKNPAAVALGKLGGVKDIPARARSLSARKRAEIAKKAARLDGIRVSIPSLHDYGFRLESACRPLFM